MFWPGSDRREVAAAGRGWLGSTQPLISYRMPITHTVDHTVHAMTAIADGPITLQDVRRHLEEERREAGLSYAELIDARGAIPSVSPADVRSLVGLLRDLASTQPLGPTAVIVSTDYAYGVMRMLSMLVEDICAVRPFRSIQEAERWLQSPAEAA